jgi:hypothetical protein
MRVGIMRKKSLIKLAAGLLVLGAVAIALPISVLADDTVVATDAVGAADPDYQAFESSFDWSSFGGG